MNRRGEARALLRVRVEVVCCQCDSRDHDPEDVETPCQGSDHEMIASFEAEAEEKKACEHEWCREINCAEADFRLKVAIVESYVTFGDEVV